MIQPLSEKSPVNEKRQEKASACPSAKSVHKNREQKGKASKRGRSLHIHTLQMIKTGIRGYSFVYHPKRLSCIQRTSLHPTQLSGIMDKVLRFQDGGQSMGQNSVVIESRCRQVV